jgi:hypothetical protein
MVWHGGIRSLATLPTTQALQKVSRQTVGRGNQIWFGLSTPQTLQKLLMGNIQNDIC